MRLFRRVESRALKGSQSPGLGRIANPGPGLERIAKPGPGLGRIANPGPGLGRIANPDPGLIFLAIWKNLYRGTKAK